MRKIFNSHPDRIIVRAPNWLGDSIMALPVLTALREKFSPTRLSVACRAAVRDVFVDIADDIITTSNGGIRSIKTALRLRREYFDLGILLPNSFSSAAWMASAGARRRIGYAHDARSWLLSDAIKITPEIAAAHQSVYYMNLLRGLGIIPETATLPKLRIADTAVNEAAQFLLQRKLNNRNYAVIAPCSAFGVVKDWQISRYAEVARLIDERYKIPTIFVGTAAQRGFISTASGHKYIINAAGELNLGALFAILRRAKIFVGGDSGAAHAAAALDTPTIAIFGITESARTRPLGDDKIIRLIGSGGSVTPRLRERATKKSARAALDAISIADVFAAVAEIIRIHK